LICGIPHNEPLLAGGNAICAILATFLLSLSHGENTLPDNKSEKTFAAYVQLPQFTHDDVEIIERETVWKRFFRIDRLRLRHRLFGGGWSPSFERELVMRAPSTGVLLFDPQRDEVVLVEQFRVGALADDHRARDAGACGSSPWLLELVAGMVGDNETPAENACREAWEESSCVVTALLPIAEYFNSPGGTNEKISLFCGRVDASDAGGVHGLAEEHEDIRVRVMSVEEAHCAVQSGQINNAMAIIALQWLKLRHIWIKEQWQD
jgi:ADP-ribose pyrophosphatase